MNAQKSSVKKQVLLYVLLPIFIAFLALELLDYSEGKVQAIELAKNGVQEKSQAIANHVDSLVINASRVASTTAVALSINEDWSEEELYEILRRNIAGNPLVYGSAIAFEPGLFEGRRLFSPYAYQAGAEVKTIDIGKESYDYTQPQWEWYVSPRKLNRPVWTEPYFDEGAGNIEMVTYSVPFYRQGRLAGITTVDLDLSRLPELANVQSEGNTEFYILSKGGTFVYHRDPAWLGRPVAENNVDFDRESLSRLLPALEGKVTGVQELHTEKHGMIWLSTAPIHASDWQLVVRVNAQAEMQEVETSLRRMVVRSVIVLLLSLAALLLFVNRILEPISMLAKAARDVMAGKPFSAPIRESSNEVGVLAKNITVMTERLQDRERSLMALNEELEQAKQGLEKAYSGMEHRVLERTAELRQAMAALQIAGQVYKTSSEGMVVTDEQNNIIAINPAFSEITGYSEEEVLGKNPKILSSGRHEPAFFRDMWNSLVLTGRWKGEIWNKRRDGDEYIEWLSIDTIYNENGTVHRRVALFSDITEKKKTESLIWNQAYFDHLTQLPNRRLFNDRLEHEIKKAQREKSRFALMFMDLDRFKEVNDSLGHHIGDELLIDAAKRIQHCVRESDTVARFGGDEFTVILSELDDAADAGRVAQHMLDALVEPFQLGEDQVYISVSIGITIFPDDAKSAATLLRNADQAMYAAKKHGRNRFSYFTPVMEDASRNRMRLASALRNALAENQFMAHYQPIVELATGQIHKAEALLRWQHPEYGPISPADFIPIAEETGSIYEIGNWIFRQAVREAARCQELAGPEFQISVNKSPAEFHGHDDMNNDWIKHLESQGVSGRSIVVEITEGLLMSVDLSIQEKLFSFRDTGIQVAIDDFGTGYAALAYLKKFDIDYLKIDQSFVRNLAPSSEDMALCEAIVVMAHKLDLKVIAEGIETREQHDLLKGIGCDYGQGYFFAKPMPAEEFEKLLAKA